MRRRAVVLTPEFLSDLASIGDYIAEHGGRERAAAYVARIEAFCRGLEVASERGDARDDILPGLRAVGFERSATILFVVEGDVVSVLRMRGRGLDWEREMNG